MSQKHSRNFFESSRPLTLFIWYKIKPWNNNGEWPVKCTPPAPYTESSGTLGTKWRRPFRWPQWQERLDEVRVVWYYPIGALIAHAEAIGAFCEKKVIYDWQGEVTEANVPLKERYACLSPLLSSSGSEDSNWATWEVEQQSLFLSHSLILSVLSLTPLGCSLACPRSAHLGVLRQDINLNEAARPVSYQL